MGFDFLDWGFPKSGTDWKSINGKPYITVSTKGRSNGLSNKINDGADFGPDTTLNATSPYRTGAPYTQTNALKEAINYAIVNKISSIYLIGYSENNTFTYKTGTNDIYDLTPLNNFTLEIKGVGDSIGAYISFSPNSGITFNNLSSMSIVFEGLGIECANNAYGLTINGTPNDQVSNTVFFNKMVIGGINGTPAVYINNVLFISDEILLSDNSAPSIIIDNCWSTIEAIRNNGYMQFTNSSNSIEVYANIGFYEFYTNNQITPFFKNMASVHIGTLNIQQEMIFSGTNTTVTIDNLISVGNNNSAGDVIGYLSGIGTSPTIQSLHIGSASSTFSGPPPIINSNLTVNAIYVNRIINPNFVYQIPVIVRTVSISTNPPVSGTLYQNTNPYDIRIKIPITYNPTTSASASLATGISSTSTVTLSTKVSIPAGLTAADGQILTYDMEVPAGWYYELIATNATIGTAEVQPI